jgi:uncharacterized protein (DUF736 family)
MKLGKKLGALAAILVLAAAGIAIGSGWDRFAGGSAKGQNPVATAGGQVNKPRAIRVRIKSRPRGMKIGAQWATTCAKGTKSGSRGDQFRGRTPIKRRLRLRFRNPDVCNAWAKAGMKGQGKLRVILSAQKQ